MRIKILYFLILFIFFGCKTEQKADLKEVAKTIEVEQEIAVKSYNYDGLKPFLNRKDNKVYVVNFWATWCAPCVKELPAFEKLNKNYADKNVEFLLVSLDFPKKIKTKLIPFIKNNNLQSKVVVLDDNDEQRWINDISKEWSGALPATIIYNKNKRSFYEQSFDYATLEKELKNFLN